MPCKPLSDSDFDTGPSIPGLHPSIQLPDLNIPFPAFPLDDLQELFDTLNMILPPGTLKPNFEPDVLNDVLAGIDDLLKKFFPFLMMFKFILPILNMILCIIEILCSLTNPVKIIRALRRLFRVCIPEFLALFPFFALILMIISLLLLLLALIEYLIQRILQIIRTILRNILLLARASSQLNNDSIIAIVKKIGDLLCVLQNLFILFAVFNVIIQIIKAILSLKFRIPPCDSGDGSDDGCCTPDVCPAFIRDNSDIISNTGNFLYYGEVGIDSGLTLPPGFAPMVSVIRSESWQFYDANLSQSQAFGNITHAFDLPPEFGNTVFFPAGVVYNSQTNHASTPYTINFRLQYDPAAFGRSDPKGIRFIKIKNAIIQNPPTFGTIGYSGASVAPFNGTINLVGGVITEDDDTPIFDANNNTTSLNDFFHRPFNYTGTDLHPTDGVLFSNLTYTFSINHEILVANNLITIGCVPEMAEDRDAVNASIGAQFNANGEKLGEIADLLPDMDAAQKCISDAILKYRTSVSTETTEEFQTAIENCLGDLRDKTIIALTAAIKAGFDQYKSDFTLDPSIQFTTLPIKVLVALNESSGQSITSNLPPGAAQPIADQISSVINFGKITKFSYDGSKFFVADITSKVPGNGTIQIAFDNNFISILDNPTDINSPLTIKVKSLPYTFVESTSLPDGEPRRDEGDVSRDES